MGLKLSLVLHRKQIHSEKTHREENSNTVINESFETKSPSSTLVDGLRVGTSAKARINFGGLTQAGIPAGQSNTGKWGVGRDGDARFEAIYGNAANVATPMLGTTIFNATSSTIGYIPEEQMKSTNIGDGNLYGIRFTDHTGNNHTVRMVYKKSVVSHLAMT